VLSELRLSLVSYIVSYLDLGSVLSIELVLDLGRRNRTLHLYVVMATNLGLWSSDPEPTQRRCTACGQDLVVVVGVKGGGENFLDGKILKTTTVGPLQYDDYYCSPIQGTCTIQHGWIVLNNIPQPLNWKYWQPYINKQVNARINEHISKYTAPPNP